MNLICLLAPLTGGNVAMTLAIPKNITCPADNGALYLSQSGGTFTVECGINHFGGNLAPSNQTESNFVSCIESCGTSNDCLVAQWLLSSQSCALKGAYGAGVNDTSIWGARFTPRNGTGAASNFATFSPFSVAVASASNSIFFSKTSTIVTEVTRTVTETIPELPPTSTAPHRIPTVIVEVSQTVTVTTLIPNSSSTSTLILSSSATSPSLIGSTVSSSAPPSPTITGKRGLAYADAKYTRNFGSKISWAYNWGYSPYGPTGLSNGTLNPSLQYIPQLWSVADALTSGWDIGVADSIKNYRADALLAYNEPDSCTAQGSSCISIANAVAGYKTWMNKHGSSARLGGPAVTNAATGIPWAMQFLAQCQDCQIDFFQMHFYTDGAAPFSYFTEYVEKFHQTVGRPIWITEFAIANGTETQKESFLTQAINFLDETDYVERYAYFYDGPGSLVNEDGSLTALGKIYNS